MVPDTLLVVEFVVPDKLSWHRICPGDAIFQIIWFYCQPKSKPLRLWIWNKPLRLKTWDFGFGLRIPEIIVLFSSSWIFTKTLWKFIANKNAIISFYSYCILALERWTDCTHKFRKLANEQAQEPKRLLRYY